MRRITSRELDPPLEQVYLLLDPGSFLAGGRTCTSGATVCVMKRKIMIDDVRIAGCPPVWAGLHRPVACDVLPQAQHAELCRGSGASGKGPHMPVSPILRAGIKGVALGVIDLRRPAAARVAFAPCGIGHRHRSSAGRPSRRQEVVSHFWRQRG